MHQTCLLIKTLCPMSGLFANDVLRTGYLTDFIKHYVSNPDNKLRSFLSLDRLRGFTPVPSSDQL